MLKIFKNILDGIPWRIFTVDGCSMNPTLRYGDLLIVTKKKTAALNDLVIFRDPEKGSIVHRVVHHNEGGYQTKGDNNHQPDPDPLIPEKMIGRVVLRIPKLGIPRLLTMGIIARIPPGKPLLFLKKFSRFQKNQCNQCNR